MRLLHLSWSDPLASGVFWLLIVVIAGGVSTLSRLVWPAGVIVTVIGMVAFGPWALTEMPVILMLLYPLIGTAAGAAGAAIVQRRLRVGLLAGTWLCAGLTVHYLLTLTPGAHSTVGLLPGAGLLITFLVLGPVTAALLPPDQGSPGRGGG